MENDDPRLAQISAQIAADPTDPRLHLQRHHLLLELEQPEQAEALLIQAALQLEHVDLQEEVACHLERRGNWSDALEWRRWVCHLRPEESSQRALANCQEFLKSQSIQNRLEFAEELLDRVSHDPVRAGELRGALGDLRLALERSAGVDEALLRFDEVEAGVCWWLAGFDWR